MPAEELVRAGVEQGTSALALINIDSTCDTWDFVEYCQQQHIKPIIGAEIRNGDRFCYVLLAATNQGFAWINQFLSEHLIEKKPFPLEAGEAPFFDFLR